MEESDNCQCCMFYCLLCCINISYFVYETSALFMHSTTLQIRVCVATESNWRWRRVCMTPTSLYEIENQTFKNKMWPQNHLSVYLKPSQRSHGFDVCSGCAFTPFQMITFLFLRESIFYLFIICKFLKVFQFSLLVTNLATNIQHVYHKVSW